MRSSFGGGVVCLALVALFGGLHSVRGAEEIIDEGGRTDPCLSTDPIATEGKAAFCARDPESDEEAQLQADCCVPPEFVPEVNTTYTGTGGSRGMGSDFTVNLKFGLATHTVLDSGGFEIQSGFRFAGTHAFRAPPRFLDVKSLEASSTEAGVRTIRFIKRSSNLVKAQLTTIMTGVGEATGELDSRVDPGTTVVKLGLHLQIPAGALQANHNGFSLVSGIAVERAVGTGAARSNALTTFTNVFLTRGGHLAFDIQDAAGQTHIFTVEKAKSLGNDYTPYQNSIGTIHDVLLRVYQVPTEQ